MRQWGMHAATMATRHAYATMVQLTTAVGLVRHAQWRPFSVAGRGAHRTGTESALGGASLVQKLESDGVGCSAHNSFNRSQHTPLLESVAQILSVVLDAALDTQILDFRKFRSRSKIPIKNNNRK